MSNKTQLPRPKRTPKQRAEQRFADLKARAQNVVAAQYVRNGHDGTRASIRECLLRAGFAPSADLERIVSEISFFP